MCRHPSKLRHGVRKFNETFDGIIRNGTVVEFFCEKGWTRKGPKQKQCLDSGLWDTDEKVKCMENHSVQVHWNSYIMFLLILVHTIN